MCDDNACAAAAGTKAVEMDGTAVPTALCAVAATETTWTTPWTPSQQD